VIVGPVTIQGKLYEDGVVSKVKCLGDDGTTIDVTTFGIRIFTIAPSCPLWAYTGTADEFLFTGEDDQLIQNGVAKAVLIFSGVETGTGPVSGAANAEEKVLLPGFSPVSEKGRMTWSWTDGTNSSIFIGTFKAKF